MALTKLGNLVDPEVLAAIASATLPTKLKFRRIAKVDNTLVAEAGSTIKIPKYMFIGDASDVPEGAKIDIAQLSTKTSTVTVKKAGKGVELTDEAILSGYGDPMGEAGRQLALAIASKVDKDCYEELCSTKFKYDGKKAPVGYDAVVNANAIFDDESDTALEKVLYINPAQETTLLLDPKFTSKDTYNNDVTITGEIGKIAGCIVSKSKRVKLIKYEKNESGKFTVTEPKTSDNNGGQSDDSHKRLDEVEPFCIGIKVGEKVNAVASGQEYYACPIVILDTEDPNTDVNADSTSTESPALTIYMKRNIETESDRDIIKKTTVVTADEHYVASLSNESKVVLANFKATK